MIRFLMAMGAAVMLSVAAPKAVFAQTTTVPPATPSTTVVVQPVADNDDDSDKTGLWGLLGLLGLAGLAGLARKRTAATTVGSTVPVTGADHTPRGSTSR